MLGGILVLPFSSLVRRVLLAAAVAALALPAIAATSVDAAACVRIRSGVFDAPGNDNYAANLNGEYIRIKNYCATSKAMGGWKLHDYGRKHTYTFSSTFRIGAGVTVTVYSGRGTNTSVRRYWGRTYGAVWNNTPPERAYLRNAAGTLQSSWSLY
jgi:lamin tail-like protein